MGYGETRKSKVEVAKQADHDWRRERLESAARRSNVRRGLSLTAANAPEPMVAGEQFVPDGVDWRELSLCASEDPEIFFPSSSKAEAAAAGIAVCMRCVVRPDCREAAIRDGDEGIRGGMTERQRTNLKRSRKSH